MLYDIFLSYSDQDNEWAGQLYARVRRFRIQQRPLRVFYAPAAITPGESVPRALTEALDDCYHVVLLITPAWLESEWCRLERDIAAWRSVSSGDRLLLPLLLRTCSMPGSLNRLRYIDFRDPAGYEDALRELVEAIRRGVQRTAAEHAAERQRRAVLNSPILPWLGFGGPSFDFLWPDMVIDPLIRPRKHPGPAERLGHWLENATGLRHACVAIVGEAGCGKTTVLRTLLLNNGGTLPHTRVFTHARDLPATATALRARAKATREDMAVIVDGLDEAGIGHVDEIGASLLALQQPNVVLIIAARREFFDNMYDRLHRSLANLVEILELCTWDEADILEFAERYAARVGNPQLPAAVRQILSNVPGAGALFSNPMRLTLLLYLLVTGAPVDLDKLQDPYSLYRAFYFEWLKKERGRGTSTSDPGLIQMAHTVVARYLYEHKGDTCRLTDVMAADATGLDTLLADSAFVELLSTETTGLSEAAIISFRHETLGEFLIAKDIITAFQDGGVSIDAALRCTVADDVNNFVRSAMQGVSRHVVSRCLANLSARYDMLLADRETATDTDEAQRLREQLLYYIGRLPLDSCPPILRRAFTSERHRLLRRSAALGAILHGEYEIEEQYMTLLDDPAEEMLNRSVQMVYFGDVFADLHTFTESGEDWSKTRTAIYKRLAGSTTRDVRLRLWDLRTLRSFYESRNYLPRLSVAEVDILTSVRLEDPESATRTIRLQQEHARLLTGLPAE